MAERTKLTEIGIRAAIAKAKEAGRPVWKSDGRMVRGEGGLQLLVRPTGAAWWYWRYSAPDGSKPRMPLGPLALEPRPGYLTLPEARTAARDKIELYRSPESRDVRDHERRERERIAAERAAAEAAERARIAAEQAAADEVERARLAAQHYTLKALLAAYVAHLKRLEKPSAKDAESLFRHNIELARPELAAKPANTVSRDDVVELLRAIVEDGRGRTAAKLRAYLRACFGLAVRAKGDAAIPSAFLGFRVEWNPIQDTGTLSNFNRTRDRALSEPELRELWGAIKALPDGPVRDALLLLILTGGQRPTQLMRATVTDVDLTAGTIVLRDPKGRRQQARVHMLPLIAEAGIAADRCVARAAKQKGTWLFSSHGKKALHAQTLTEAVRDLCKTLMAKPDGERVIQAAFGLRDVRRTIETRMAALGISKDVRGQLQSHGLGGVQGRHYDKHDYAAEKRAALAAWAAFLEAAPASNVRQLHERKAAG